MREMRDSGIAWIGVIPQDWQLSKIGSLYTQRNEKVSDKDYQPLSVTMQGILPQLATAAKTDDGDNRKLVRVGDFAINSRSDRRGSCGISPLDGSVSLINIILTPRTAMHPGYYNWLFHTTLFADEFYKWGHGIVADLWTTRWQEMKSITVPVPEYAEQERIAAFLDAECAEIDTVLEKTRASIEEYKKLKQAVITQAVTKGIRGDRPMKNSGIEWIGDIPAEWDVLNLVAHTSMLTPMRDRPENLDGPIPWVRIEDFEGKYIESSKAGLGVSMKTVKEMNLKVYPVGTILCTSSCIMGKCAIVSRELVSNQRFIGIIPDRTTDKTYLYYLMTSNAERMNFLSTGALQANLSRSAFEHLKVQFPPYSEQQEIAAYLDDKCADIDALVAKKQQYLIEIENYKKSLIYEYVTGKKEVKTSVLAD